MGIQSCQAAQFPGLQTTSASHMDRCPEAVSGDASNIRSGPNSGGRSIRGDPDRDSSISGISFVLALNTLIALLGFDRFIFIIEQINAPG